MENRKLENEVRNYQDGNTDQNLIDLLEELVDRIDDLEKEAETAESDMVEMREEIDDLNEQVEFSPEINSVKDEMKAEFFIEHFGEITLEQLESLIK